MNTAAVLDVYLLCVGGIAILVFIFIVMSGPPDA